MPILKLIHILGRVNQNSSLLEDMLLPMLMHTSAICISFAAGEEERDMLIMQLFHILVRVNQNSSIGGYVIANVDA